MNKNKEDYVESKIPAEKHEYLGWFWSVATKKSIDGMIFLVENME